jgi:hypothetical protein
MLEAIIALDTESAGRLSPCRPSGKLAALQVGNLLRKLPGASAILPHELGVFVIMLQPSELVVNLVERPALVLKLTHGTSMLGAKEYMVIGRDATRARRCGREFSSIRSDAD